MCRAVKGSVSVSSPPASGNRHIVSAPSTAAAGRTGGSRCRCGRGAAPARGASAGTTAMPPGGSAAIASAFASATRSTVPTSSRCSGPIEVTSTRCGRATAQSSAIWPSPRMPISVTRISVSGSSRQTVSGRPISLFWLASAQIVGTAALQSAPRMSFVDVFPVEPTTATTRASLLERTREASAASAASWSSGTSVAAPRAAASSTYATPVLSATKRSPGPTTRESALIPVIGPAPPSAALERAERERNDLVPGERNHAARLSRSASRSASRATSRSSNGTTTPAVSWPCSWPFPAITTTSPVAGERHGPVDRAASVGVDLHVHPRSLQHVLDDRERILAARVVGGDDDVIGTARGDGAHERPLAAVAVAAGAEDADQPARRRARVPPAARCRASPAYARSRR